MLIATKSLSQLKGACIAIFFLKNVCDYRFLSNFLKNVSVSESKPDYELTTEHSLEKWGENARQIG
jgi:hypothetical protein